MNRQDWLKSGQHLPEFMRDFHDQKDLFRAIHSRYKLQDLDWITAHVYTIDKFLWFMAQHGYTLQQSRKNVEFLDLSATLAENEKKEFAELAQLLDLKPKQE
jgi:hypothetical protein